MHVLDSIDDQQIDDPTARGEFFWLDVIGADDDTIKALGRRFAWHPLAIEDTLEFHQRPKLDRYDDHMLIVFYGVRHLDDPDPRLVEVHLLVSGNWVVTVRRHGCDELDVLRKRLAADDEASESYMVYRILDTLTDTYFPAMERIDDAIDDLEDAIVQSPDNEQLQHIFRLKRRLVALRRVITPQRDLAASAIDQIADLPGLEAGSRDYFRDVYDHLIRVSDMVDSYRDLLSSAMDVYLSTVSNRMNAVMKQLTIVATIFLPITALTGFFGQNFGWLVDHVKSLQSFLIFGVGGAVLSCVLLVLWFARARFFDT